MTPAQEERARENSSFVTRVPPLPLLGPRSRLCPALPHLPVYVLFNVALVLSPDVEPLQQRCKESESLLLGMAQLVAFC